ncbi:hypothetical protein M1N16_07375 [Nitrospinaceae bacterium]|nr:hypothetical protein [Nitrospinaceae bacterium]
MLLEETGKIKIVRDRKVFFDKVAARENANLDEANLKLKIDPLREGVIER